MNEPEEKFEEAFRDELLADDKARKCILVHSQVLLEMNRDLEMVSVIVFLATLSIYYLMRQVVNLEERVSALELH